MLTSVEIYWHRQNGRKNPYCFVWASEKLTRKSYRIFGTYFREKRILRDCFIPYVSFSVYGEFFPVLFMDDVVRNKWQFSWKIALKIWEKKVNRFTRKSFSSLFCCVSSSVKQRLFPNSCRNDRKTAISIWLWSTPYWILKGVDSISLQTTENCNPCRNHRKTISYCFT